MRRSLLCILSIVLSLSLVAPTAVSSREVSAPQVGEKITSFTPRGVPIGISTEGAAGPPAYNLNRNVLVTVIIAKENRVVANFALAQPILEDDAPKIAEAVAAALGGSKP